MAAVSFKFKVVHVLERQDENYTFQVHQIFNISYFPQFNLPFQTNASFPKSPKNLHKTRQTVVNEMSGEI